MDIEAEIVRRTGLWRVISNENTVRSNRLVCVTSAFMEAHKEFGLIKLTPRIQKRRLTASRCRYCIQAVTMRTVFPMMT